MHNSVDTKLLSFFSMPWTLEYLPKLVQFSVEQDLVTDEHKLWGIIMV